MEEVSVDSVVGVAVVAVVEDEVRITVVVEPLPSERLSEHPATSAATSVMVRADHETRDAVAQQVSIRRWNADW